MTTRKTIKRIATNIANAFVDVVSGILRLLFLGFALVAEAIFIGALAAITVITLIYILSLFITR